MDQPIPTDFSCPYCRGALLRYASGYSEYDLVCDPCEAGFAIEGDLVKSRRWDRKAARGVHTEFSLTDLGVRA